MIITTKRTFDLQRSTAARAFRRPIMANCTPPGLLKQVTKSMRRLAYAIFWILTTAVCAAGPAAAGGNSGGLFVQVQGQGQKGRPGQGPERGERERGRDARQDGRDGSRERMSEDDRRSLHRDLDKANRELYGRRQQK
jgi:hypothetical protein